MPASAQVGRGDCQPHRSDEVRCAVKIDIPGGDRVYEVFVIATQQGGAAARVNADTYISTCGTSGQLVGKTDIANAGAQRVATFTNERNQLGMVAQAMAGFCVEVFLHDCSRAGSRTSCQQVLNLANSRVEVR
jgi:hypothetical protein